MAHNNPIAVTTPPVSTPDWSRFAVMNLKDTVSKGGLMPVFELYLILADAREQLEVSPVSTDEFRGWLRAFRESAAMNPGKAIMPRESRADFVDRPVEAKDVLEAVDALLSGHEIYVEKDPLVIQGWIEDEISTTEKGSKDYSIIYQAVADKLSLTKNLQERFNDYSLSYQNENADFFDRDVLHGNHVSFQALHEALTEVEANEFTEIQSDSDELEPMSLTEVKQALTALVSECATGENRDRLMPWVHGFIADAKQRFGENYQDCPEGSLVSLKTGLFGHHFRSAVQPPMLATLLQSRWFQKQLKLLGQ